MSKVELFFCGDSDPGPLLELTLWNKLEINFLLSLSGGAGQDFWVAEYFYADDVDFEI
jgi:hypothetical protein